MNVLQPIYLNFKLDINHYLIIYMLVNFVILASDRCPVHACTLETQVIVQFCMVHLYTVVYKCMKK